MLRRILTIAVLASIGTSVRADNWPGFRGPRGDGVIESGKLPTEWSKDKNIAWQVKVPGEAWSSPIVWGDKVFLTTAIEDEAAKTARLAKEKEESPAGEGEGHGRGRGRRNRDGKPPETVYKWEVHALDAATGKTLWTTVAHQGTPTIPKHQDNTYATETPATDGERIYAYFGGVGLFCFDLAGKPLWKKEIGVFPMEGDFGTASSPVLHDGLLFLQVDNEEKSFVAAFDAKSGEEKWRVAREEKTNWCSPIIWKNKSRAELVLGGRIARSYDPKTGAVLWQLSQGPGRSSASPVADNHRLYIGNEPRRDDKTGGSLFAVKAGASGDITPKEGESTSAGVAWSRPKASPQSASPLIYQGQVYIFDRSGGIVNSFNAETGEPVLQRKRLSGAGAFWVSPWAADGKIFCLDEKGTTQVLTAGSEFKVLASNKIDERFWTTPSAANGRLFLRGEETLYCIKQ